MNLYPSIFRRKSCRKFNMQPLSPERLSEIDGAIESFTRLSPSPSLKWRFTDRVSGLYHVEAPHYLIISGDGVAGENVGFLFQQLALWLDAEGLGCVWLGEAKDAAARSNSDIITIAFGSTVDSPHRTLDQFKRKAIENVTNSPEDFCIKAAHLAPSGLNTQPWYFEKQQDRVLVYKQKLKLPISLVYKHSDIDMGIALCHYWLACVQEGLPFSFKPEQSLPKKPGYLPFGVIE
ncbi:hypothetical protein LJC01_03495 [Clostridiaceae bacterium OttesenSCG-928-D20]|nr:hypothetical protein [Clostridiaceae bacterium OttesenSCG-928-D20]